jgi:hypothetical protein
MFHVSCVIEGLCRQQDATDAVIAYELDAAAMNDEPSVRRHVERTGVPHDFYAGRLDRLQAGSAADQITDALNDSSIAMTQAGFAENMVIVARCTIVGHLIRSSGHGSKSRPLLGIREFQAAR